MPVRVGTTLPQFRHDAETALAVARHAEHAGLDGVFVFDHLWPLGRPDRPALHSHVLLGAVAAETSRVVTGPLVARVGLLPDAVLVHAMVSLHRMTGGRVLVTLGTGDRANRRENEAYGVGYPPAVERLERLMDCCRALQAAGVAVWVGGRSEAVRAVAAHSDGWNAWGVDVGTFAAGVIALRRAALHQATSVLGQESGADVPLSGTETGRRPAQASWAGPVLIGRTREEAAEKLARYGDRPGLVHGTIDDLARHLRALAAAGATWAVCAPLDVGTDPRAVDYLAEAAAAAG